MVLSCNRYNTKICNQTGGTALIGMGELVSRKQKEGTIHDALGRWTGIAILRKPGRQLRVISAYQPIRNEHSNGTYQQQVD